MLQRLLTTKILTAGAITACLLFSCKKDDICCSYNGYPSEVGKIILSRCAVSGCHTDQSKEAAAGLTLQSWNGLFQGSRWGNTAVIPYRADQSFLMYFINTFSDLGPSLLPVMPFGQEPLTREEVMTIRDWIGKGAPDKNGFVKFSNPISRKLFTVNQGCDNVYIINALTGLIARSVNVGASETAIESPHYIETSGDEYFYVCFFAGTIFQKFHQSDGSLAGQADIGPGQWSTFSFSEDGLLAFVVDWNSIGSVAVVDVKSMSMLVKYQGGGLLEWPHGSAVKGKWLYVTAQYGNFIYKIDITDIYNPEFYQISLQPGEIPNSAPKYDAHEIHFSPDGAEYAVACQRSGEVRFFNASNDSLIATVPAGYYTQEPHYSGASDYLFVACQEDNVTFPGKTGSVAIINYKTHKFVKSIYTGWQPHGIIPDDEGKKVWVLHRNATSGGPAPHHSSTCSGRNGYITVIDLNTLELVPVYKAELSVDPFFGAISGHHH